MGVGCGSRSRARSPVCVLVEAMVMSTGTPESDWSLRTGMRAEAMHVRFLTHGWPPKSSESAISAELTAPGGHEMSRSTTSMSEEERARPVEREP